MRLEDRCGGPIVRKISAAGELPARLADRDQRERDRRREGVDAVAEALDERCLAKIGREIDALLTCLHS
jgi:hypothetical protein